MESSLVNQRIPILVEALCLGLRVQVGGVPYQMDSEYHLYEIKRVQGQETLTRCMTEFWVLAWIIQKMSQAEFEKMVLDVVVTKYKQEDDT